MESVTDKSGQTPNDESGQGCRAGTEKLTMATCDGFGYIDGGTKKDDIPKKDPSVNEDGVCNFRREKSIFFIICVSVLRAWNSQS